MRANILYDIEIHKILYKYLKINIILSDLNVNIHIKQRFVCNFV